VNAMDRIEFHAMGTQVTAVVDAEALPSLDQVPLWFAGWEKTLSRFREDGELSRLNRTTGTRHSVSPTLLEVLQASLAAAVVSEGLVVPTLHDAMLAEGYDRSFDEMIAVSSADRKRVASRPDGLWKSIEVNQVEGSVHLPLGARLDLGGIAKGWAADRAARMLSASGPALVDAGGDISVTGPPQDGYGWPIGVADPYQPGKTIELLMVEAGGIATSGRDRRRWMQDGQWKHHIIDPRTGLSARTDVLTATVLAPDVLQAEVAAKVALILGSREGLQWIEERPWLAGLLVLGNGELCPSSRLHQYQWSAV